MTIICPAHVKKLIGYRPLPGLGHLFNLHRLDVIKRPRFLPRAGIHRARAQNYHADSQGVELNFCVMSDAVATFRKCKEVPVGWNDEIEKDFKRRGGRK